LSAVQTFVSTTPQALEPNLGTTLDPAGLLRDQSLATTTKPHRQLADSLFPQIRTRNKKQPAAFPAAVAERASYIPRNALAWVGSSILTLERACLGRFVDFDRLAPQHLMNGGLEPQVRPRNISGRQITRTRQGDGVEAAHSNVHSLWLLLRSWPISRRY
jgi:hypothetical protein